MASKQDAKELNRVCRVITQENKKWRDFAKESEGSKKASYAAFNALRYFAEAFIEDWDNTHKDSLDTDQFLLDCGITKR
jgi:hypothetical protein